MTDITEIRAAFGRWLEEVHRIPLATMGEDAARVFTQDDLAEAFAAGADWYRDNCYPRASA